jgi:Tol biopolymer transport system component
MLAVAGTILILAALAASSAIPFLAGAVGPTATTPSNGLVAFTHDGDVYVVEPSPGSVPRAIATGPDDDVSPLFSPDGRHLAFFSIGEDGEVPMLTDANGSEPRALVSDPFAYGLVWADWSPDSSALLVTTDPARPPNGATEMALLATDGSGALEPIGGRDLIPDPVTMGTVRPGSDLPLEVLFRVATDPAELWFLASGADVPTVGQALAVEDMAGVRTANYGGQYDFLDATWAPDGSRFAYHTLNDVEGALDGNGMRVHVATYDSEARDGEGPARNDTIVEFDPLSDDEGWAVWSPDGSRLAFQTYENGWARLVIVPVGADGTADSASAVATEPTLTLGVPRLQYAWAPDGTSLVMATYTGADQYPAYLVDATTGDMEPLGWETDEWPTWGIAAS